MEYRIGTEFPWTACEGNNISVPAPNKDTEYHVRYQATETEEESKLIVLPLAARAPAPAVTYDSTAEVISGLSSEMEVKLNEVFGKYASSGNPDFDSILNYKLSAASAVGAKIELDMAIPTHLPIEAFDINVILGNLLDNANEALAQSEVKELNVGIRYDRGMIFIHVSNTYCGEVRKEVRDGTAIYSSTKEEPECHGLGLSGVAAVVEKYGGSVYIDDAKGKFKVDIVLYLS